MDFSLLTLFGAADAGCRIFSLSRDGFGPRWTEVTNATEFTVLGLDTPNAKTEEYELPDRAEHGTYLLCTDDVKGSLCADVTL